MNYLQTRPETEAQEIFSRIRHSGDEDVYALLQQVREGGLPLPSGDPSLTGDQRLPPIQMMLDAASGVSRPPLPIALPAHDSVMVPEQELSPKSTQIMPASSAAP